MPAVTPLHRDGTLDEGGLGRLIDHLVDGGVDGIFLLGTTGEYARIEGPMWEQVVRTGVRLTAGRVPVYVGVTAAGGSAVRERAEISARAGADAIVLSPTYYFSLNQDEMVRLYTRSIPKDALPLFLYNIPQHTISQLEAETARRIAEAIPVAGIKDSSGDIERMKRYLEVARAFPGFQVMVGSEAVMSQAFKLGAAGVVPSLGNVFPALLADIFAAAGRGDWEHVSRQCVTVDRINVLNNVVDSSLASVAWKKYALSRMGVCSEQMTEPFVELGSGAKERIDQQLASCGLEVHAGGMNG